MRVRRGSAAIVRQSSRLCGEASGEVNSRNSTPNASRALAISTFCAVVKKALANCSPSRNVDSIMAKFVSDMKSSPQANSGQQKAGSRMAWQPALLSY